MKEINLKIDCTEEYCNKCNCVLTSHFGQKYWCGLFKDESNNFLPLDLNGDLRLLRADKCKDKIK